MSVISVKKLKKYFGSIKAVDDISFEVEKGEIFGFLGPNGAGKTTTIKCILDMIRPTDGEIKLFGKNIINSIKTKEKTSYVASGMKLYDNWTGREHIDFFSNFKKDHGKIIELINKFDFNPDIKIKNLSFGNKQKLALLLAFLGDPQLIILDEPTVGLDPILQKTIYELLEEYSEKGVTIFMSSHNLKEVENLCSRVAIIKNGKLVAVESINDLKRKRIYKITIEANDASKLFSGIVGKEAKILHHDADEVIFQTTGDINTIINEIAKHNIKSLEINRADLEEIFLEFYK